MNIFFIISAFCALCTGVLIALSLALGSTSRYRSAIRISTTTAVAFAAVFGALSLDTITSFLSTVIIIIGGCFPIAYLGFITTEIIIDPYTLSEWRFRAKNNPKNAIFQTMTLICFISFVVLGLKEITTEPPLTIIAASVMATLVFCLIIAAFNMLYKQIRHFFSK